MKANRAAFHFTTAISGFALAAGAVSAGVPAAGVLPAGLSVLWMLGFRSGWRWAGGWMLFLFWAQSLAAAWLGAGVLWAALGLTGALAAWELDGFVQRMAGYGEDSDLKEIGRRHLLRVGAAAGLGLLLVTAALSIPLGFRFGWAALAALLVFVGVSQAVRYLRRGE